MPSPLPQLVFAPEPARPAALSARPRVEFVRPYLPYQTLPTLPDPAQALCGYAPGALRGCAEELLVVQQRAAGVDDGDHPAMAVKDKYRDGRWLGASRAVPPLRLPERLFAACA